MGPCTSQREQCFTVQSSKIRESSSFMLVRTFVARPFCRYLSKWFVFSIDSFIDWAGFFLIEPQYVIFYVMCWRWCCTCGLESGRYLRKTLREKTLCESTALSGGQDGNVIHWCIYFCFSGKKCIYKKKQTSQLP